jgi:RND family efflux transporter MFP subunit
MKQINYFAVLMLSTVIFTSCKHPKPVEKIDNAVPVKVISADELQEREPLETSGLLSSEQQSNLSFKTGGIIHRILVKEGDHVRKGQVLAVLNMTEVSAQMNQAEETYQKAKRDAQRIANLFKDSVSTREQLENTQTSLAIAKKQLDIARFNNTQSSIVSNTDGVVLKKLANEGEQVAGGAPVLFVSGVAGKDWVIKCGITDKDRARISGNEKAEIHFDAYSQTFSGKVKTLAQGSDSGSGLYQVEVRLEPGNVQLVSGLFAKVKIYPAGKTDLLSVPVDALIEGKNDSAYVFTAVGQKAQRKAVKLAYLKGNKAFISSGLTSGDQVIREGSAYLTEGSLVKIIK